MTEIERVFAPRPRDLGGFTVGRVLPFVDRRTVGPFVFLDHMGPANFGVGQAVDVRPHPHIGLSTLTYLFEGEMFHRDNLGNAVQITSGAVNWMTAGRGIAHSERTSPEERKLPHNLHGLQFWVALPKSDEETAPEFHHYGTENIPELRQKGVKLRIAAGDAYGARSPVKTYSPLYFVEAHLDEGAALALPNNYRDQSAYVIDGTIEIEGKDVGPRNMVVFAIGKPASFKAKTPAHVVLVGGEPFAEPRHVYWNFVSSSQERIEQAKADWKAGRFARIPGDDKEFIPLPD